MRNLLFLGFFLAIVPLSAQNFVDKEIDGLAEAIAGNVIKIRHD